MNYSFQQSGEPTIEQMEVIGAGLRAHHAAAGHERVENVFSFMAFDMKEQIVGAFIGSTLWGRLYIRQLWVAQSHRGQGLGSKLLELGEAEGVKRECRHVHTDTFSWQSPQFYFKKGYKQYAILEDYPIGSALHYVTKSLE